MAKAKEVRTAKFSSGNTTSNGAAGRFEAISSVQRDAAFASAFLLIPS